MHQIDDLSRPILIGNANRSPSSHDPDKVRVRDLKSSLVGKVNGKSFERSLLSCFPHLFRSHTFIIIGLREKSSAQIPRQGQRGQSRLLIDLSHNGQPKLL